MAKRSKTLMLVTLTMFVLTTVRGQTWQWATKAGGLADDTAKAIEVDNLGNSFVAGTFYDSISFGSTTLINVGLRSVYIAKYDPNGNLLWAKIGAKDSDIAVNGIAIGNSGNIFIVGQYIGTATFGNMLPVSLISVGDHDVFVANYDDTGELLWARSLGGAGIDYAGGVSSDKHGNVFLVGDFHLTAFPFSGSKLFIAKFDQTGDTSFLKISLAYGYNQFGHAIKVDSMGNSFIAGSFFNAVVFDSTTILNSGNAEANAFLAKVDPNGNVVWAQKAGAPTGYCASYAIDVDHKGNAYITGFYRGTISLGPYSITSSTEFGYDVFIAKCDTQGNFVWVNKSQGRGGSSQICVVENGDVYISGGFSEPLAFGATSLTSVGGEDGFIVKMNPSGNFVWAISCGGTQHDRLEGMRVTSTGVYICGEFTDHIQFGNAIMLASNSNNKYDIFVGKLVNTSSIKEIEFSNTISIFPNPTNENVEIESQETIGEIAIWDINGKALFTQQGIEHNNYTLDTRWLTNGIYFLQVTGKRNSATKKLLIQH